MASQRVNCVAVDGSEPSLHAFNWYIDHYHRPADSLVIVTVHKMPKLPMMSLMDDRDECVRKMKESVEKSKEILTKFESMCEEKEIKCISIIEDEVNSIGEVICNVSKKNNANVIIMGQRGLNALSRFVVGSVSDYVLHHTHIPVIVVPK